jgi:hypothetical protein
LIWSILFPSHAHPYQFTFCFPSPYSHYEMPFFCFYGFSVLKNIKFLTQFLKGWENWTNTAWINLFALVHE